MLCKKKKFVGIVLKSTITPQKSYCNWDLLQPWRHSHKCNLELQPTQKQPSEVFVKIGVLKDFAKFTGKYLCQSPFFNKVERKKRGHRCFCVNFTNFLITTFFIEHLWWLLLETCTRRTLSNIYDGAFVFAKNQQLKATDCFSQNYVVDF